MAPRTGLVNGYKLERHDPAHRIWIGNVYNFCARLLFRIRIRDIDCDYRLIRRALLDKIHLTSTSGTICVELVRKLELSGWRWQKSACTIIRASTGDRSSSACARWPSPLFQLLRLWVRLVILK